MRNSTRIIAATLAVGVLLGGAMYATAEKAKQPDRAFLGIAAAMNPDQPGVTVQAVNPEGPAAKAGLKAGDRIVNADNKEVKTFKGLVGAVAHHKPGDALPLKAVREGKEQTFTVKLGTAPAHFNGTRG